MISINNIWMFLKEKCNLKKKIIRRYSFTKKKTKLIILLELNFDHFPFYRATLPHPVASRLTLRPRSPAWPGTRQQCRRCPATPQPPHTKVPPRTNTMPQPCTTHPYHLCNLQVLRRDTPPPQQLHSFVRRHLRISEVPLWAQVWPHTLEIQST